ncbi:hypothetical protein DFH29DRAFT_1047842 [Suillus ampliporus]|nr:hypothetical protein DFH29DRAFT_1047842 [Suillus ampliporus]
MLYLQAEQMQVCQELAARSVPLPVRKQSMIQFQKQGVESLEIMEVAECNEVIIAKIARQDYPMDWPSLLADIMDIIHTNLQVLCGSPNSDPWSTLVLRRGLALLNCILKEFGGIKMLTGMKLCALLTISSWLISSTSVSQRWLFGSGPDSSNLIKLFQSSTRHSDYGFPVHFLLQAMVLFKENLTRWTPFHKGGPKTETSIDLSWGLWSFADESHPALLQEFVEDAIRLVSCFIPLNLADLKG